MLGWAITFLIIALIAAVLGFGGIAGFAVEGASFYGDDYPALNFRGNSRCARSITNNTVSISDVYPLCVLRIGLPGVKLLDSHEAFGECYCLKRNDAAIAYEESLH